MQPAPPPQVPQASEERPAVAVRLERRRERFDYHVDNPSNFNPGPLVPHFFEQRYDADNTWILVRGHYRLAGAAAATEFGITPADHNRWLRRRHLLRAVGRRHHLGDERNRPAADAVDPAVVPDDDVAWVATGDHRVLSPRGDGLPAVGSHRHAHLAAVRDPRAGRRRRDDVVACHRVRSDGFGAILARRTLAAARRSRGRCR